MPAVTPTRGKFGSPKIWFLVGGYNLISAKLQGLSAKKEALMEKSDGCGDSWEEHTPVGTSKAEVKQEGAFWDTSTGNIHDAVSGQPGSFTPQSVSRVMCLGFEGNVTGQAMVGYEGSYSHVYEVLAERDKLQKANVEYLISGKAEDGVIVKSLGAVTADGNTESTCVDNSTAPGQRTIPITSNSQANPTVVTTPVAHGLTTGDTVIIADVSGSSPTINGERTVTVISTTTFSVPVDTSAGTGGTGGTFTRGKTNAGASCYLQMTSITLGGHDNALVTVRHSDDAVTFADLVAFTARTTIGAERVTVAGAVRRYLAQSIDLTGSGTSPSVTYLVGVARN